MIRIGIDLDNTLIFYDEAFARAAEERGLLPANFSGSKQHLRDTIRSLENGEAHWQALQGYVYGQGIAMTSLFPGARAALAALRAYDSVELFIVSHKTEFGHGDARRVNLREAATNWLRAQGVFDDIPESHVYFADTREEKCQRIEALALDWFIDDLPEVLSHPLFPPGTRSLLFAPDADPMDTANICASWPDIVEILENDILTRVAGDLLDRRVTAAARAAGGGNSRIYRITTDDGVYALKRYPPMRHDPRDRLGAERAALAWFAQQGMRNVPRWINGRPPFALLGWIEGDPVTTPQPHDIDKAAAFLRSCFESSAGVRRDVMPTAADACPSGAAIAAQFKKRLSKLESAAGQHPELRLFLDAELSPAIATRKQAAEALYRQAGWDFESDLPHTLQRLIPADFGFHNALRRTDGNLAFLDFEYFGWDDPVRVIADFLLHPAMRLGLASKRYFTQATLPSLDPNAGARLHALYPLFGLRWALILLNEFLPEHHRVRAHTRGDTDWSVVKMQQLKKARRMLYESASLPT